MAVRRVRRILRRIDPWTVLKVSLVFNTIAALVFVLGSWVAWSMALRRGIPERVVEIFDSLTLTLTIDGPLYFRIVVLLAIVGGILATAFMTLGAVLYNLIADLVGGVEFAVLEETYKPMATRTRVAPAGTASGSSGAAAPAPGTAPGRVGVGQPEPAPDPGRPLAPAAALKASIRRRRADTKQPAAERAVVVESAPRDEPVSEAEEDEVSTLRAG